jgi:hypothetical protein
LDQAGGAHSRPLPKDALGRFDEECGAHAPRLRVVDGARDLRRQRHLRGRLDPVRGMVGEARPMDPEGMRPEGGWQVVAHAHDRSERPAIVILIDAPRPCRFGRCRVTAHMVSDTRGLDGSAELVRFAESIGMSTKWRQRGLTPSEHFDLMGKARIDAAIRAGARIVSCRELARVVRAKRGPSNA